MMPGLPRVTSDFPTAGVYGTISAAANDAANRITATNYKQRNVFGYNNSILKQNTLQMTEL